MNNSQLSALVSVAAMLALCYWCFEHYKLKRMVVDMATECPSYKGLKK